MLLKCSQSFRINKRNFILSISIYRYTESISISNTLPRYYYIASIYRYQLTFLLYTHIPLKKTCPEFEQISWRTNYMHVFQLNSTGRLSQSLCKYLHALYTVAPRLPTLDDFQMYCTRISTLRHISSVLIDNFMLLTYLTAIHEVSEVLPSRCPWLYQSTNRVSTN
jgi:hypothetical protein